MIGLLTSSSKRLKYNYLKELSFNSFFFYLSSPVSLEKYWCPESLGYVRPLYTCHGRPLFQKVPKILPKNRSWGILPKAKCCSVWDQQNFFLSEINFICMNFIRLQGLAAGTVSGRNNGRPRCYVEFGVRAKPGFSNID